MEEQKYEMSENPFNSLYSDSYECFSLESTLEALGEISLSHFSIMIVVPKECI
jgi:hypothetical protein